jgi:uncharacterized protein YndB with AHSA1/START domain
MLGREFKVSRTLNAPLHVVWRALTDRELLSEWLMPNDFEPTVGHEFTLQTDPSPGFDGRVRAKVLELEPLRRMLWSWRGGPIDTTVEFRVQSLSDSQTRVDVTQRGFTGARAVVVGAILRFGWWKMLRGSLVRTLFKQKVK